MNLPNSGYGRPKSDKKLEFHINDEENTMLYSPQSVYQICTARVPGNLRSCVAICHCNIASRKTMSNTSSMERQGGRGNLEQP